MEQLHSMSFQVGGVCSHQTMNILCEGLQPVL